MITEEHFQDLDKLVSKAIDNPDLISEWEHGFCTEWADKLDTYNTGVRISDKQNAVFDKIRGKLEKAGVL